jgi:hypothetical protein
MYTLGKYTGHQRKNWAQSKRIVIYESESQLLDFIRHARKNSKPPNKKMYFGTIPEDMAARIKKDTGAEVKGYNFSISENEIRKIFKSHGSEATEAPRGQRAITEADIASIPKIVQNPDKIILDNMLYNGKPAIKFVKTINGRTTVVSYVSDRHSDLAVQTMYSGKTKDGTLALLTDAQAPETTSKTGKGTGSATRNIQNPKAGKMGGKAMGKGKKEKAGSLFGQVSAPKGKKPIAEVAARLLTHFKRSENDFVTLEPRYTNGLLIQRKRDGWFYLDIIGAEPSKLGFVMHKFPKYSCEGTDAWLTAFECVEGEKKGSSCVVNTRECLWDILNRDGKAVLRKDESIPLPKQKAAEPQKEKQPMAKTAKAAKTVKSRGKRKRLVFAGTSRPIPDISKTNIFKTSAEGESEPETKTIPARLEISYSTGDPNNPHEFFRPKDLKDFTLEKIPGKTCCFYFKVGGKTLAELLLLEIMKGYAGKKDEEKWLAKYEPKGEKNMQFRIFARQPFIKLGTIHLRNDETLGTWIRKRKLSGEKNNAG